MDKSLYMAEVFSQLNNVTTYTPLGRDPTNEISEEIFKMVEGFMNQGIIDKKLGDFLINIHPITPVFYVLPKVHKNLNNTPGRPIVASTNSLLSPLAVTLEKILTPLIPNIPSFLKDTSHFLEYLKNMDHIPSHCLLVTLGVNNLYTSINHQKGISADCSFLNGNNFSEPEINFCLTLLTFVLTKNFFLFEDRFYIQNTGTAMGSNAAPPYANIFIAQFESSFVYNNALFQRHQLLWKRYIDDIFLIWNGDSESLRNFVEDINNSTSEIKFTVQYDENHINFLDTEVILNNDGSISTELYIKPTDRNSLLLFSSSHPRHIKEALPFSQLCRVGRIVSDDDTRKSRLEEMRSKFKHRGYPDHVLSYPRQTWQTKQCLGPRVAVVNTYHPFINFFH
ncbi:uncharacterized protein [Phyllobates terribilis]|uniref:uncharacterized protein n=1 Tax=Phyllobates terribilis TaxID=111132 RepID=UPI003CCB2B49